MSAEETVARVLCEHCDDMESGDYGEVLWSGCTCGHRHPFDQHSTHVAAEIVRALGLVEERIETAMCDDETRTISDRRTEVRYVTPWQTVEEASDVDA